MKKRALLRFAIEELRHNLFIYVLCLLLLSSIISTALFLISADRSLVSTFYNYASSLSPNKNGVLVEIGSMPYDSLHMVEDLSFDSVYVKGQINGKRFTFNGETLVDLNGTIQDINSGFTYDVSQGDPFTSKNCHGNYIWVCEDVAEMLDCKIGEYIIQDEGSNLKSSYTIIGFYTVEQKYKGNLGDFYIPIEAFYYNVSRVGLSCQLEFYAVLSNPADYYRAKEVLKNRGIIVKTELDDEYKTIALIDTLLKVLFFIVLCASMLIVFNIAKIVILNRIAYIMRLRMLGLKSRNVIMIYWSILELTILIAFSVAYILNRMFGFWVSNVVSAVFPNIPFSGTNPYLFSLIGIGTCTVILVIEMLAFIRRIDCSNIADLLQNDKR